MKQVIYKSLGVLCVTPEENHKARIQNARLIQRMEDFDSPKEIIDYYCRNGGLPCKRWSLKDIKDKIKADFGAWQRVYKTTCILLQSYARCRQQ
jgi:hypothetical protein